MYVKKIKNIKTWRIPKDWGKVGVLKIMASCISRLAVTKASAEQINIQKYPNQQSPKLTKHSEIQNEINKARPI